MLVSKNILEITSGEIRVFDVGQQLAEVEPEVLSRFGVDVISAGKLLWRSTGTLETVETAQRCMIVKFLLALICAPMKKMVAGSSGKMGSPCTACLPTACTFSEATHPLADLTTPEELAIRPTTRH